MTASSTKSTRRLANYQTERDGVDGPLRRIQAELAAHRTQATQGPFAHSPRDCGQLTQVANKLDEIRDLLANWNGNA